MSQDEGGYPGDDCGGESGGYSTRNAARIYAGFTTRGWTFYKDGPILTREFDPSIIKDHSTFLEVDNSYRILPLLDDPGNVAALQEFVEKLDYEGPHITLNGIMMYLELTGLGMERGHVKLYTPSLDDGDPEVKELDLPYFELIEGLDSLYSISEL